MAPSPVGDFTALVLHLFAHVRSDGPEDLFDRRYVEWVKQTADPAHQHALAEALAMLTSVRDRRGGLRTVQIWPELFSSVAQVLAAPTSFDELSAEHVHAESVRRSLAASCPDLAAQLHRAVLRAAPSFMRWHEDQRVSDAVGGDEWNDAAHCMPSLLAQRVECARSLGSRGRALPSRIIVGVAAAWHGLDPYIPAVVALHELSVIEAEGSGYAETEWAALVSLAKRMRAARDALREAHAVWLSSLDLRALVQAMQGKGALDEGTADALLTEPKRRALRLQQLESP